MGTENLITETYLFQRGACEHVCHAILNLIDSFKEASRRSICIIRNIANAYIRTCLDYVMLPDSSKLLHSAFINHRQGSTKELLPSRNAL